MPVIAGIAIGAGVGLYVASLIVAGGFMSHKWPDTGLFPAVIWPVVVLWWFGERLAVKVGWK